LLGTWVNHDWRERGQATVWVLRRGAGGRLAMAAFLVDLWCAGLKDAWGLLDVRREDFEDARDRMSQQMDGTIAPCPLDLARRLVAGGIRFAVQNGFRLADRYDRWVGFLGQPRVEWRSVALDGFGLEGGKLRWVAPLADLRARYIGGRLEDFLARPDVEFVLGTGQTSFEEFDEFDDKFDEEDEEHEEHAEHAEFERSKEFADFRALSETAADAARRWCTANGISPEPMLVEAMGFSFAAMLVDSGNGGQPPTSAEFARRVRELVQGAPVEDHEGLTAACAQAEQFVCSFEDPMAFLRSISPPERHERHEPRDPRELHGDAAG
jgi:hypothetical protein